MDDLIVRIKTIEGNDVDDYVNKFLELVKDKKAQEKKLAEERRAKQLEEQKQKELERLNIEWTTEDIQNLTKAIVKIPPGSSNRWRQIAETVGRTQKEVIQKAKEIHEKQRKDVEEKRRQEEE